MAASLEEPERQQPYWVRWRLPKGLKGAARSIPGPMVGGFMSQKSASISAYARSHLPGRTLLETWYNMSSRKKIDIVVPHEFFGFKDDVNFYTKKLLLQMVIEYLEMRNGDETETTSQAVQRERAHPRWPSSTCREPSKRDPTLTAGYVRTSKQGNVWDMEAIDLLDQEKLYSAQCRRHAFGDRRRDQLFSPRAIRWIDDQINKVREHWQHPYLFYALTNLVDALRIPILYELCAATISEWVQYRGVGAIRSVLNPTPPPYGALRYGLSDPKRRKKPSSDNPVPKRQRTEARRLYRLRRRLAHVENDVLLERFLALQRNSVRNA